MKRSKIPPYSTKRLAQLVEDVEIKKKIILRCGGIWYMSSTYKGVITNVRCVGGKCENCGKKPCGPDYELHNHELTLKSQGGRITEENSQMWCNKCHSNEGHGKNDKFDEQPQWAKRLEEV